MEHFGYTGYNLQVPTKRSIKGISFQRRIKSFLVYNEILDFHNNAKDLNNKNGSAMNKK